MDFRHPVEAVIPGARGRILAVLAAVSTELSAHTIARLARVSPAQTARILPPLVELGLVERRDVPPSALFRLVEDHVAGRAVLAVARARDAVLVELARTAAELSPPPLSVVVYGSLARGEAGPDSDVDVIFVRPGSVDVDDDDWASSLQRWRRAAARLTGNSVEVLEVDESEIGALLRSDRPLWKDVSQDGVVLAGRSLRELRAP